MVHVTPPTPVSLVTAARLEMRGIRKSFGATVALDGVDLAVATGQVHALVGENGAGKSTLMKVLSGAIRPDGGTMLLDGKPYAPASPLDARRVGVAMIYQELSLCPHLSVEENILLGMEPCRGGVLRRDQMRQRAAEALDRLGHADIDPRTRVGRLAPAAQQIVEVARALAIGCRVLVLDEPTSSLSQADAQKLFVVIDSLRADGHAIVYISHFLEEVRRIADRVTVLRDGRSVGAGAMSELSTGAIVSMMIGRDASGLYRRSRGAQPPESSDSVASHRALAPTLSHSRSVERGPEHGDIVLDLTNLAGRSRPIDASLQLRRGEVVGIAGLMSAGRTELLRTIFGLDPVRSGKVRVGVHAGPASPARRWAQGVGMLSEDRKAEGLALSRSIADNLTLTRLAGLGPMRLVLPGRQRAASAEWIERLGIRCQSPAQRVSELSGGNQQKIALARLLYHDCDVLLLDEPTRGIDIGSKEEIYRLIDALARGESIAGASTTGAPSRQSDAPPSQARTELRPRAVLMVSSYLPELLGVCDRIAVMHRGRLGPARPVAEISDHQIMLEATGASA